MKESAMTALSYLKSKAETLASIIEYFDQYELQHPRAGGRAVQKMASAGITMFDFGRWLRFLRKEKIKSQMQ